MAQSQTDMPYVRLGKSGLKVSKLILGCMSYGSPKWETWVLDEVEGIKQIKMAYDLGINAITFLSRKHIFASIKSSLERLQLDYVDLLQCHRFDPETPIEGTMQALHDVVKAGYVRYIGMSSCYAWQFQKMQNYAKTHGLTEFVSMQNYHNAIYREEEREMVPLLQDLGVGMIPWSPLARGFLTRPVTTQTDRGQKDIWQGIVVGDLEKSEFLATTNARIAEIAKARNVSMAQVAIAWSLSKPFISAPIIGTTSINKLKDLVAGVHLQLTEEETGSIDAPYMPRPIIGH
ncbi:hypothetical protein FRB95_012319 [Tulasnella sp. JGI-2019a]|nr:hypothetical protein FRB95_012319 [Tulasnella sp. JGI-2019a]